MAGDVAPDNQRMSAVGEIAIFPVPTNAIDRGIAFDGCDGYDGYDGYDGCDGCEPCGGLGWRDVIYLFNPITGTETEPI